jgi:hypothetical protein
MLCGVAWCGVAWRGVWCGACSSSYLQVDVIDASFSKLQESLILKEGSADFESVVAVKKRHFLRHLYIKVIILPRQARDKHRESTQKKSGVSSGARGVPYRDVRAVSRDAFLPSAFAFNCGGGSAAPAPAATAAAFGRTYHN